MSAGLRRLAFIVFVVVFLGAASGTGAWALWSQSATATAQIEIGEWEWELPLDVKCGDRNLDTCSVAIFDEKLGKGTISIAWSPRRHMNENAADSYVVRLAGGFGWGRYDSGEQRVNAGTAEKDFSVPLGAPSGTKYSLTVTPFTVGGIKGESTSRCFAKQRVWAPLVQEYRMVSC